MTSCDRPGMSQATLPPVKGASLPAPATPPRSRPPHTHNSYTHSSYTHSSPVTMSNLRPAHAAAAEFRAQLSALPPSKIARLDMEWQAKEAD
jgi:hypothetical protein